MLDSKSVIMIVILILILGLTIFQLFNKQSTTSTETSSSGVSIGTIMLWIPVFDNSTIPSGWAVCDGSTITVNGKTQTLPDLRGRFVVGVNQGSTWNNKNISGITLTTDNSVNDPTSSGNIPLTKYDLNFKDGEEKHILTTDEIPPLLNGSSSRADIVMYPAGDATDLVGGISGFQSGQGGFFTHQNNYGTDVDGQTHKGGGLNVGHNNIPPYYAAIYIIKVF